MWESLIPSLISAGTNIFGAMTAQQGAGQANQMQMQLQRETNAQQMQMFRENQQWQENMANTAYQRQMTDMRAAGLNPILAYQKGGGAPVPSTTPPSLGTATVQNEKADAGKMIGAIGNSAVTAYKDTQSAKLAEEQRALTESQTKVTDVEHSVRTHENEKKSWEAINERKRSGILDEEHTAAKANAKQRTVEAENVKNYGQPHSGSITNPSGIGISAESMARRILEMMNNYGGPQ